VDTNIKSERYILQSDLKPAQRKKKMTLIFNNGKENRI